MGWRGNRTAGLTSAAPRSLNALTAMMLAVAVLATGTLTDTPAATAASVSEVHEVTAERVSGSDRFAVSANLSRTSFPGTAGTVYVASGMNFPDALSAAPVAARAGGPLLLVQPNTIPPVIAAEITRLKPQKIVIVGGTTVVSRTVAAKLRAIAPTVTRISGSDRYATSRALARHGGTSTTAYLASGASFPDALSAGAAAGSTSSPVILINGATAAADTATIALLRELKVNAVKVVGGTAAVTTGILRSLTKAGFTTTRLGGTDRFDTSVKANADQFTTADTVYLATGYNYPDALGGAAAAGLAGAPLYTVPTTCVPAPVLSEIIRTGATHVILLGGTAALSTSAAKLTPCDGAPATVKTVAYFTSGPDPDPALAAFPHAISGAGTTERKVFAHYFPPYPVSFENADPTVDYYARNYLTVNGESGKHAAYGGLLRDRPEGRAPRAGSDWKIADMRSEVVAAADSGIDGFTVDLLGLNGNNWDRTLELYRGAETSGRDFTVVPNLDMTASAGKAEIPVIASKLAELYDSPVAYQLPDGRHVLSSFLAENQTPAWWASLKTELKNVHGVDAAVIAVLLNSSDANMTAYAPISYALSNWGDRTVEVVNRGSNKAAKAHALGVKWMDAVAVQDTRPRSYLYAEASNTQTLRASWARTISTGADLVQLVTWNDYSEGTSFAPSAAHGDTFLDINSYYATWFKTGSAPKLVGDAVHITHRTQKYNAVPLTDYRLMTPTLSNSTVPPRDTVEVLTVLAFPATVTATVGGSMVTYSAPAGVSAKTFPLRLGEISASVSRGDTIILEAASPFTVVDRPLVQDMQYFAVTGVRPYPPRHSPMRHSLTPPPATVPAWTSPQT